MKMLKHKNKLFLLLFMTIFFTASITAEEKNNFTRVDYGKLCDIYNNVVVKSVSLSLKEMSLTEEVQNKLPELFNSLFIHIIKANANNRYKLIKDYAFQQNNVIWKCESALIYYGENFK